MHVPIVLHSKGARLKRNKHIKLSFDPRIIIFSFLNVGMKNDVNKIWCQM